MIGTENDAGPPPSTGGDDRLFSSTVACEVSGVSYRQLDYWSRLGVISPTVAARGSGRPRRWSVADVHRLTMCRQVTELVGMIEGEPVGEVWSELSRGELLDGFRVTAPGVFYVWNATVPVVHGPGPSGHARRRWLFRSTLPDSVKIATVIVMGWPDPLRGQR